MYYICTGKWISIDENLSPIQSYPPEEDFIMETQIKKKPALRKTKKWHKWIGLFFSFFLLMFAISGIFLNHRRAISSVDIPRSVLPSGYHYKNWNNGAVKNSIKLSADTVLLFGGSGIWLTNPTHSHFEPFVKGMKKGADNTNVSNIIRTPGNDFFAVTTFGLYRLNQSADAWENYSDKVESHDRFTDLALSGDTLVLMSRSHLYLSAAPYTHFVKKQLPAPQGYVKQATLFRTLWKLHSGELFGFAGKIIVDFVGSLTIFLCITGIIITFWPNLIKRKKKKGLKSSGNITLLKGSFKWHNKIGGIFFILLLIVCISGMFLRPPLMIAIIRAQTAPIPGTTLNSANPWFDKLRCLRYDTYDKEWILYSSQGFFRFKTLDDEPQKINAAPPVSVMGVNVLNQQDSTTWVVGSFSGIYRWNKQTGESFDFFTGIPVERRPPGMPTFTNAVSGYSNDFFNKEVVFEYGPGARIPITNEQFTPMPVNSGKGRISLWHLCLEVHVGRIYSPIIGFFSEIFVFLAGTLFLIILISGYLLYRKTKKAKRKVEL